MDACRSTATIELDQIPRVRKGQLPDDDDDRSIKDAGQLPEVRWKVKEKEEKKVRSVLPPLEDSDFPELSVLGHRGSRRKPEL